MSPAQVYRLVMAELLLTTPRVDSAVEVDEGVPALDDVPGLTYSSSSGSTTPRQEDYRARDYENVYHLPYGHPEIEFDDEGVEEAQEATQQLTTDQNVEDESDDLSDSSSTATLRPEEDGSQDMDISSNGSDPEALEPRHYEENGTYTINQGQDSVTMTFSEEINEPYPLGQLYINRMKRGYPFPAMSINAPINQPADDSWEMSPLAKQVLEQTEGILPSESDYVDEEDESKEDPRISRLRYNPNHHD